MLVQYHFVKFAIKILYTRYILKIHENKRRERTNQKKPTRFYRTNLERSKETLEFLQHARSGEK